MSEPSETTRKLSKITDAGLFERLAISVLREACPKLYSNFSQPGVNPEGKTVKSPVDGIAFVPKAAPPHMVVAHHTTGAAKDLEKKWLHDPSTVKPRKGGKPSAPPGDINKTMQIVKEERIHTPNLRVTLALTTTVEPTQKLTRDVQHEATKNGIEIDIWSGARIAHYLDNHPEGQWLREHYLCIAQRRLSRRLLQELSRASLDALPIMVEKDALIDREADLTISEKSPHPVAFVVGESGFGKSVACFKHLNAHVESGGCALVIRHDTLEREITLDRALDLELRRLHPNIEADAGAKARALCSLEDPLLILIEDLKWSDQPALLMERIVSWNPVTTNSSDERARVHDWHLYCPVWPQTVATASEQVRKRIDMISVQIRPFTKDEARVAILRNAELRGAPISPLDADSLAKALGNDPLLVGLFEFAETSDPRKAINSFIANQLRQLANSGGSFTATTYREALIALGHGMLENRLLNPTWKEVEVWMANRQRELYALQDTCKNTKVLRIVETADVEKLAFRHDRVRSHILIQVVSEMMHDDKLTDLLSEPYFADVVGGALASGSGTAQAVELVRESNPLALFYALKEFREPTTEIHEAVLESIHIWLQQEDTHGVSNRALRRAALAALTETESSCSLNIARQFRDHSMLCNLVRFRNGDIDAGVQLCLFASPGVGAPWRDSQIEHARVHYRDALVRDLDSLLRQSDIDGDTRAGALRLAGFLEESSLEDAIEESWRSGMHQDECLADYLWAAAECCGNQPERLLEPLCDSWAALSDEQTEDGMPSLRNSLAAHGLRFAFRRTLPPRSLRYFILRAQHEDLRWPITYMLHEVDQPDAVAFLANELADMSSRSEETGGYCHFAWKVPLDLERRQQERGDAMSSASRKRLEEIWSSRENGDHLRRHAFRLWASTRMPEDLPLLHSVENPGVLADDFLEARLKRGDETAIPALVTKLNSDSYEYWWQMGREIWTDSLTNELNEALGRRGGEAKLEWGAALNADWIMSELVMCLDPSTAKKLLMAHWEHLKYSPLFVQAALYVATPCTKKLAAESLTECENPDGLLEYIAMHFGVFSRNRSGIERITQLEALVPYSDSISASDIYSFWETCNERGWLEFRRAHLDGILQGQWRDRAEIGDSEFNALLDKQIESKYLYAEDWLERHMKCGESLNAVLSRLGNWLKQRRNICALEFVADVVALAGQRNDLEIVNVPGIEPKEEAQAIAADTQFAVYLRSLT